MFSILRKARDQTKPGSLFSRSGGRGERDPGNEVGAKLRRKEYADRTCASRFSYIEEGDQVLLKQARENKLLAIYEPDPYKVVHKDGKAVILKDTDGSSKLQNIAHMKKFTTPETAQEEDLVQATEQP